MSKKYRDSLEFKYRLRKYVFSENACVLHLIFSHTLSVCICMPDTNSCNHADEMVREKAKQFGLGLMAGALFTKNQIDLGKHQSHYSELNTTEFTGKYLFQRCHIHCRSA